MTLHRKFTALAIVFLMVSLSLATVPTQSQIQAVITAANASVPGNYVTLKQLALELHNAAVAYTTMANANRNDGTLAKWDSTIKANKARMISPPNLASLTTVYKRAVAAGYQGSLDDFTKYLPTTQTAREKAYTVGVQQGLYRAMLNAAKGYQMAADKINSMSLAGHPRLVYAGFHYHVLLVDAAICSAIDWGITFLMVTAAFTPSMIMAPVWGAAGLIWFGIARPESGC
jgi:uncharacterized MnhB-related membrane protein